MTGPEAFREALRDIEYANRTAINTGEAAFLIARAQVHATLALAAATALAQGRNLGTTVDQWQEVAS